MVRTRQRAREKNLVNSSAIENVAKIFFLDFLRNIFRKLLSFFCVADIEEISDWSSRSEKEDLIMLSNILRESNVLELAPNKSSEAGPCAALVSGVVGDWAEVLNEEFFDPAPPILNRLRKPPDFFEGNGGACILL